MQLILLVFFSGAVVVSTRGHTEESWSGANRLLIFEPLAHSVEPSSLDSELQCVVRKPRRIRLKSLVAARFSRAM